MKSQTKKEHLLPCRIVKSEGEIIAAENLFHEKPLQIGLMEPELTTVNGKAYIILDYGKEICGSARILTFTMSGPCRIRLRFGESVSETSAELGEKGACNDHALRDIRTNLENYSDMTFCHTGFRFLRIDFLDDVVVNIKSILAVSEIFEAPVVYEYKGGDKRIAEILRLRRGQFRCALRADISGTASSATDLCGLAICTLKRCPLPPFTAGSSLPRGHWTL